jgi:hypothetical protein
MWALLLVAILVAYALLKHREMREPFVVKYGNPFDGEDLLSFERNAKGTRLFSTTPDTCPLNKSEYDAGLCYEPCDDGYNGVGPMCWAHTQNVGIGTIPGLEAYKERVTMWGSIGCSRGRSFRFKGYDDCYEFDMWKLRQVCYDDRENKDGLCYRKCPKDKPDRVPVFPYLCAALPRGLGYGRGVGSIPPLFHFGA